MSPLQPIAPIALTRAQVREVDRIAIERYGIPGIVLMENAARGAADIIRGVLAPSAPVAIVCGSGNNGGDGFAIARHLSNHGFPVVVFLACDPARLAGDPAINHAIIDRMSLPRHPFHAVDAIRQNAPRLAGSSCIIDAVLGTGFSGRVRAPIDLVIEAMNSAGPPIIAIDVPSGLDCDSGVPCGETIRAERTITFVASKTGFNQPGASAYTGIVHLVDIGSPPAILESLR